MSSEVAISVRGVGKTFRVNRTAPRPTTLAESLAQKARRPFTRPERSMPFEALRDVSFEVRRGDAIGLIGRNGAGKSTLLKILSQITPPTCGEVDLAGRVSALLEVGTGFHPELTGRENIYFNGTLLGMSRRDIDRAFDSIVAFAETEHFLDTPVKRYSSGMYVRLAFAIAAHVRPDILIVDEVLAVGDLAFQRKCLGKMDEVSHQHGTTVLFVSHNMSTIAQLCRSAICLDAGRIVTQGPRDDVIRHYLGRCGTDRGASDLAPNPEQLRQHKQVFFRSLAVLDARGHPASDLDVREPFHVRLTYEVPRALSRLEISLRVLTTDGRAIFTSLRSDMTPDALLERRQGVYECRVTVPGMLLMPGRYALNVAAHAPRGEIYDLHEAAASFTVRDTGTNFANYGEYAAIGVVIQNLTWQETVAAAH